MNEFFANLYEMMIVEDTFSDNMYEESLYLPIGLSMILIPMVFLTLYYYVVNSARFSKWWHWLLFVAIICAINFVISYSISYSGIVAIYPDVIPEGLGIYSFSLSLINAIYCFIVSFIWSMIIKWGSSQCRRTPF